MLAFQLVCIVLRGIAFTGYSGERVQTIAFRFTYFQSFLLLFSIVAYLVFIGGLLIRKSDDEQEIKGLLMYTQLVMAVCSFISFCCILI